MNKEMERGFKGVWIPKNIWLSKELNMTEKFLLIEIDSLCNENADCYASNQFLGEFLGLSKDTVSNIISKLAKRNFITVTLVYRKGTKQVEKRFIKINDKFKLIESGLSSDPNHKKMITPPCKNGLPPHKKMGTPPHEKVEVSNTSFISNTIKTTTTTKEEKNSSSSRYDFLEKKNYTKINSVTKKNIVKNIPNLTEAKLEEIYMLTELEVANKFANDFNAVMYKALLGEWIFKSIVKSNKANFIDKNKEKKLIKASCNNWLAYLDMGYPPSLVLTNFLEENKNKKHELLEEYKHKMIIYFKKNKLSWVD
ncbi:MAG: helix-turn-helix domain-containing protein [Fusobacteriaceae bacterium]